MLHYLRVRNLAVLESLELELPGGFVAVTGETGAGKSVLLGALSLLAGARADKGAIRQGADTCEVEGALWLAEDADAHRLLRELDLPPAEEGALIIRRSFSLQRPPRVEVNGALTTLAKLQALGESWVDFHGPGEPQKLFSERHQREIVDAFAGLQASLAAYRELHARWRAVAAEIERVQTAVQLNPDEVDFLTGQVAAIDAVDLRPESLATLERDFQRLSRAQEVREQAHRLSESLSGDRGIEVLLGQSLQLARALARIDPAAASLSERLESAAIEVADIAAGYEDLARAVDFEERTVAALHADMEAWLALKRKYGGAEQALARRVEMQRRLDDQGDIAGSVARLEAEAKALESRLRVAADALREGRERAAARLGSDVQPLLLALGFKRAVFEPRVVSLGTLGPEGDTGLSFHFSANAGQEPAPLNRIASSGELARVMLALKAVLARADGTPVLVFDEVDANVGGEIAAAVGKELAALGARHQVFCVTHAPQVAGQAPHHFEVVKEQRGDATAVSIRPLAERESRLAELARMLGDRHSQTARRHAEELLRA